jgi:biopolymer transport protein ExbD
MSRHKEAPDYVEPDLPITPMLDMSFQLMAFFIFTFRPAPTEGQIAMSLPKQEGGDSVSIPSPTDDKPEVFVVKVEAASNGTIAKMSITQKDAVDTRSVDLGADIKTYQKELKDRYAAIKAGEAKSKAKVTLEIADNLLHEYVVQLLDNGLRSGFTNIAPVPLDAKKR